MCIRDSSKAVPEICGSSLTTIGGLVAMLFMEFRLGFDLGICLIKSIFFSQMCIRDRDAAAARRASRRP